MRELLTVAGKLTPLSSKTHITYQLYIPEGMNALHIEFEYGPKTLDDRDASKQMIEEAISKYVNPALQSVYLEHWKKFHPLQNLLTLSVDDPDGFRGSAHRHPNHQQHILSLHESSPGFFSGPIQNGVWKVTISVHCIVTQECEYQLRIREGEVSHEMASV